VISRSSTSIQWEATARAKTTRPSSSEGTWCRECGAGSALDIAFFVEPGLELEVDDVFDRLRAHGAELVGEVARYEDIYRYCYVRGPAA
jgi:hypothetical protein